MTNDPNMMSRRELIEYVNDLEARVEALETAVGLDQAIAIQYKLGIRPIQARIVAILMSRPMVTKRQIFNVLYGSRIDGGPTHNVIDVHICHIRKAIPAGVRIDNIWATGYALRGAEIIRNAIRPVIAA